MPAESPETVAEPLVAPLATPGPLTTTDVAFAVLHVTVAAPGTVAVVGLTAIVPETEAAALTV